MVEGRAWIRGDRIRGVLSVYISVAPKITVQFPPRGKKYHCRRTLTQDLHYPVFQQQLF